MLIDILPSIGINVICCPWATDKNNLDEMIRSSCKFVLARLGISATLGNSHPFVAKKINELNFALEAQRFFIWIHELGHLFAAKTITVKEPELRLMVSGGEVIYSTRELTPFGQRLGLLNSKKIILLAGPLFESLSGALAWVVGSSFENEFHFASYLKIAGITTLVKVGTNICSQNSESDYKKLENLGFSRQGSFMLFVVIPLILAFGYIQQTPFLFQEGQFY